MILHDFQKLELEKDEERVCVHWVRKTYALFVPLKLIWRAKEIG